MSLKNVHPSYAKNIDSWNSMRDFYDGEKTVKKAGEKYLPPTAGMVIDGMGSDQLGRKNYDAYKKRAVFPDYVKEGVGALIGLLHQKPAKIEMPAKMEYLLKEATIDGETLELFYRKVSQEQMVTGRLGILCDIPKDPDQTNPKIFLSLYAAETIVNWDDGATIPSVNELNLVVLDESGYRREGFEWKWIEQYRVLQLGQLVATEEIGVYSQGEFEGDAYQEEQMFTPMFRGATLNHIPFVFINSKDLLTDPDKPPLEGLGELCLAIYRGEADYRQNLHMQGQDTLVIAGGVRNQNGIPGQDEDAIRVGAGSRIDVDIGGDAKYVGVDGKGLAEQRTAIEGDRKRAESRAGQLVQGQSIPNESGNAMLARLSAQTANLKEIALSAAAGLEKALRFIAEWMGEDPNAVKVTANLEFTKMADTAQEFVYLMTARSQGAPLSLESIHRTMKERGYTSFDYEQEMAKVKKEGPNGIQEPILPTNQQNKGNPNPEGNTGQ